MPSPYSIARGSGRDRTICRAARRAKGRCRSDRFRLRWLKDQRSETIERVASAIQQLPEVTECHLMAGDADLLLRIAVADIASYRAFQMDHLARIKEIERVKAELP
ncbi:Lrp/AsnC ligand binding domain-containing protein [Mesorhizobium sp. YR577]|uniref:Lrp/AsnC ligand binding domain-containing protein n=1 Tax=Mesorhizobium sp. YR577 TaxID=1884373 RepID=UPI00244EF68E|nr:Lrp/AsnC ligand binding domain-containing protein [Mesorhizobium sp. YR577]